MTDLAKIISYVLMFTDIFGFVTKDISMITASLMISSKRST